MRYMSDTNLLRLFPVLMVVFASAYPLKSFADRDQKCVDDCREAGYQWSFCDSKCSYNQSNSSTHGLDALSKTYEAPYGMAGAYQEGRRRAIEDAKNQEDVERLRLQNEILRRQLEGVAKPQSPSLPLPATTPQRDQITSATEHLAQGIAAYGRQNYGDAALHFGKAAELGNVIAQTNLGTMYAKGQGVPRDPVKAVELFRGAAGKGYAPAINNLGSMHDRGEGVAQDYWVAFDLYRMAAEKGNVQAQANLGYAYEMGRGVPKNETEALAWYRRAASSGNELAKQRMATIEKASK